jgi:hypothetical protein
MNTMRRDTLTITVADRSRMDREIQEAVDAVRETAMQERNCGILVTRRGPDSFPVTLRESVPFGITKESQEW